MRFNFTFFLHFGTDYFTISFRKLIFSNRNKILSQTFMENDKRNKISIKENFYQKVSNSDLINEKVQQRVRKLLKKKGFRCRLSEKVANNSSETAKYSNVLRRIVNRTRWRRRILSCDHLDRASNEEKMNREHLTRSG